MAGNVERYSLDIAQAECLAIGEQVIELRSVTFEFGSGIEQLAEDFLHANDLATDGELSSKPFLQIGRGRDVIGMSMRLDLPLHFQTIRSYVFDDAVGRSVGSAPRCRLKVEDRIDNRRLARGRVVQNVGDRIGRLVEKACDRRALALVRQSAVDLLRRVCEGGVAHPELHLFNVIMYMSCFHSVK